MCSDYFVLLCMLYMQYIYILFNHKVNINFSQPKENDMSAFF